MSDDMMILSGKLRIETQQFTQGVKAAAAETRTSADQIAGAMSRVTKAANDAARGMSEASAHIAASSWASRRAAEQEAETRRQVATVYKETEAEIKKHRTYEQVAASQKIRTLQAEGWAAKRAADQEIEAFRAVGKAAQDSERQVSRARSTMRDYIAENNKLGGSGRRTVDNPFTFRPGNSLRTGPSGGGGGFSNAASMFGGAGGSLGAAARVGGPVAAGVGVAAFGLSEAAGAEVAYTRLQSVLKATGGQAGRTAEQITAMGTKIQQTTIYTDNAAIKAQTFLATLDNLSGQNFDDATKAAADLASVMEIDLESAAHMVGRALQDPENGLRALASAGVKFTDQQKALIATMMESGDVAGAQRVILDELAHRMGGAASDAAKTMSGRLQQATNDVASLGQTITEKLLSPLQALADLDKSVGEGIARMIDPEAAKGLENKQGGAAFDRERKLKAYLSSVDTSGMANNVTRDAKGNLQLNAAGIAEHTAKFNAMSAADQAKYDYETDQTKAYDTTGKWDARTQAQQTDASLKQIQANERNAERQKQERWRREEEARQTANMTPQAKAERAANFAQSSEGAESLKAMPSEQGKAFMGGLVADVKTLGASATNTGTTVGVNGVINSPQISGGSQADIDATLKRYRVMFEQMPQFSAEAWKKIEEDLQFNLRNASISADEQREFYLKNAELVAQGALKIFDEYDKKREEQVKKDEDRAKRAVAKIDPAAIPNLRNATQGQAQAATESMGHDITGTLKPDENGVIDTSQVQTILDNYKAVLSQMPRYSEPIFKEIEAQVVASAKAAAESTGAVRAVHLEKMKETLANAGAIVPGKTQQVQAGGAVDPYASLAGASKQDLGAAVAQRNANVQTTRGIGIGTPEQKKGMIELAQLQAQTMKAIQNSTGETRQKNIEELKRLDEAWAMAYKKIREGSKETVDALTADSKKQGDAMTGAAAKAGKQQQQGQFSGVGDMMAGINQMSQGLSNMFMGAMNGLGNAGAAFGEYLNSITDPVERIDAQITQARAKLKGAQINAGNFAGTAGGQKGFNDKIRGLEQAKADLLAKREMARKEAYRKDREARDIHTADEANTTLLVGARAQTDLYGPGFRGATNTEKATPGPQQLSVSVVVNGPVSPNDMLNILDDAAKKAGWDRSGRSFLRSQTGRS